MDNQLPAEVLERIDLEAKQFAYWNYVSAAQNPDAVFENIETWPIYAAVCYRSIKSYMCGQGLYWPYERPRLSTEYASKLAQVEQENKELKQWKKEAQLLLNPILEYGQSKEAGIQLGKSITKTVLEQCKQFEQARTLLEKITTMDEVRDHDLANEIKTFLDGTK
jgi:hypothetical protein